ncbi:putative basic amino acid antiporter YfcC [Pelagicoccus mobilis]|uniref:Basic amino acid antiporter YfcC n=1 Tax=Pelagicoccus mobilis TaxID=415221 RepID=A0A934RWB4_9BACT|nr:putative basic amino acid antiporter YfcC [Pelagicoccus mobilis]MBK1875971.1 putative basic amino acid antiporter YfcC [Pelagicoccus mobilis]
MSKVPMLKRIRSMEMPDAYIIIFFVIALAAVATYIIPAGYFDMKEIRYQEDGEERTRTVIDPDSFRYATDEAGDPMKVNVSLFSGEAHMGATRIHRFPSDANSDIGFFNYAFEGITSGSKYGAAVGVVAFILVIGGAFGIISRTGAIEVGILRVIEKTKGHEIAIVPILFLIFSLGGAIFGMSEEAIAFAMIVTPLLVGLGYDSITAVLVTYGATQIGFATSWMNPFNISVAQGLAEVEVLSGAGFRIIMWLVFTIGCTLFVMLYALRIRRNPQSSRAYESDAYFRDQAVKDQPTSSSKESFSLGQALVLATVALGVIWIILGVTLYQYYIPEIATQFFIIGVISGIIGVVFHLRGMGLNDIARSFRKGASELLGAAMIVGMAKGIVLILGGDDSTEPSVLNTLLHQAGQWIAPLPSELSAIGMLIFQSVLNFFIPSGSGQAALTVPLMAPLADIAGLSRQIAVLAFQLGDGLTNLIIPTSASLMGTLAVARLDYVTWFRFFLKIQFALVGTAILFMAVAVAIGYN